MMMVTGTAMMMVTGTVMMMVTAMNMQQREVTAMTAMGEDIQVR